MRPIDEHDEFLLSRLLDGDLTGDEVAALRERIAREPALQEAYESLARVDRLVVGKTRPLPDVDWSRFQARLMDRIESPAQPARVIRLPRWARVAMPFAVAAAVAWMLWLAVAPPVTGPSSEPIEIVYNSPQPQGSADTSEDTLLVQFDRAGTSAVGEDRPGLHVAFPRSTELAQEIRRADEARESLPSWHLFMVNTPEESEPGFLDDFLGLPPM